MYLVASKIIFSVGILVLSLIAGLIPMKIRDKNKAHSTVADAFSSGVFMGAALLHMLPDAISKLETTHYSNYPVACLIFVATFILLLLMERGLFIYSNLRKDRRNTVPIFLVMLLSTHSLIEGAAIGINDNFFEALAIFIAVFAHKGSESFALTTNLQRFSISKKNVVQAIIIFSTITPVGILIASYIIHILGTNSGNLMTAAFNAIAAGTFLYLSTEHLIEGKKSFENIFEIIALITGIGVMAIVAMVV